MSVDRARILRKRMPPAEAAMWNALRSLRPLGHHFRRQVSLGRYFADFASHAARLVIELDGETHFVPGAPAYDAERDAFLHGQGYRVLRFSNHDALTNIDGVMTLVLLELEQPVRKITPTLDPSPQGGGRRRSRKIVELGHRSIDDLPPPVGAASVLSSPSPLWGGNKDVGGPRTVPDEDQHQE